MTSRAAIAKRDAQSLGRQIAIRLSEEDVRRLDALDAALGIMSRNAIARAALRIGLAALEDDPRRIAQVPPPRRGRKPKEPAR